jgi:hypothetical protein
MMLLRDLRWSGLLAVAAAAVLAPQAMAQSGLAQSVLRQTLVPPPAATSNEPAADADEADAPDADSSDARGAENNDGGTNDAGTKVTDSKDTDIKDLQLDWSQLNVDGATLAASAASKARKAPQTGPSTEMSWSSNDKADGSSAVSVKQTLSEFLDARVGADMTVAREPQTLTESQLLSEKLANGGSLPQSSGTAWAAITAPGVGSIWDKTAVEARLDPSQDQTRLGTTLSKSVPFAERYSLSLENGYNLVEQGVVPVPGIIGRPVHDYETEQNAKLSIADTGTSFSAGQTLSAGDDKWLRKVGAEQKLLGGVTVSGSIGETSVGTTNKSLTAGFKQSW